MRDGSFWYCYSRIFDGLYWIFLAVFVMYIGNFRFFDVVFMYPLIVDQRFMIYVIDYNDDSGLKMVIGKSAYK